MKLVNRLMSFPASVLIVSLMQIATAISQAQNRTPQQPAKPGTTAPSNTFFKTWRDPREDAFRIGVPDGWRASGGTVRLGSADVRHVVRAESPDGTNPGVH